MHGYVLRDFAKAEAAGRDKLLDAVAAELPRLVEGDDAGFMSRVAHVMNPPKPKPPKPEPEAEAPGAHPARTADEPDGL